MSIRGKLQRLTAKTAGLRFSSRKWDEGKDPHDHHPANNNAIQPMMLVRPPILMITCRLFS